MLQTPHSSIPLSEHTPGPPCLAARGPTLNTALEVRPHQSPEGRSPPAACAAADTLQDAIGHLGHLGTLLAHVQPSINHYPQVLFLHTLFLILQIRDLKGKKKSHETKQPLAVEDSLASNFDKTAVLGEACP